SRIVVYLALAFAAAYRKREPLPRKTTPLFASIIALTGLGLIAYALSENSLEIVVAGSMLFGAAQGIMGVVWLTVLPSLTYRISYLYILASHAVATALCFVILFLPSDLLFPLLALCMLSANICAAFLPEGRTHTHSVKPQIESIVPFLWKGVLSVGVFAFLSGFMSAITAHATDVLTPVSMQFFVLGVSAAVIIIMLIPALAFRQPLKLESGYKVALPLSALGFLILPGLINSVPPPVAGVLATTGYMLTGIILYCTIAEIAKAADTPSAPLFAGSDAITLACLLLGSVIGSAFATRLSEAGVGVALVGVGCLYLIAIGASSFFGRQVLDASQDETPEQEQSPVATTLPSDIAQERGLNEQEQAIFFQLIEGRTTPRIAQDLYLSSSTVKYHTQKIYRKFDVHSRAELSAKVKAIKEDDRS
ncbi:MAG: LuxR family transcriptional regulator, partial [Raoultibacter sp.]